MDDTGTHACDSVPIKLYLQGNAAGRMFQRLHTEEQWEIGKFRLTVPGCGVYLPFVHAIHKSGIGTGLGCYAEVYIPCGKNEPDRKHLLNIWTQKITRFPEIFFSK